MTRLDKIIEAVHPFAKAENIKRLNNGDLSHIGDAIEAGEKELIFMGGKTSISETYFENQANHYQRIKSTYTLAGVEVPRPLVEEPKEGDNVWIAGVSIDYAAYKIFSRWNASESNRQNWQLEALKAGLVYKTENDAIALSEALSKLVKNSIKEALANS